MSFSFCRIERLSKCYTIQQTGATTACGGFSSISSFPNWVMSPPRAVPSEPSSVRSSLIYRLDIEMYSTGRQQATVIYIPSHFGDLMRRSFSTCLFSTWWRNIAPFCLRDWNRWTSMLLNRMKSWTPDHWIGMWRSWHWIAYRHPRAAFHLTQRRRIFIKRLSQASVIGSELSI